MRPGRDVLRRIIISAPLMMRGCLALLFIFCLCFTTISYAFDENIYSFSSTADAERFEILTKETRCVVCQNQSIADSRHHLQKDLRGKIYRMVLEKIESRNKTIFSKTLWRIYFITPTIQQTNYFSVGVSLYCLVICFFLFVKT